MFIQHGTMPTVNHKYRELRNVGVGLTPEMVCALNDVPYRLEDCYVEVRLGLSVAAVMRCLSEYLTRSLAHVALCRHAQCMNM